eukprot:12407772-Karenia_brevis.AAC.1
MKKCLGATSATSLSETFDPIAHFSFKGTPGRQDAGTTHSQSGYGGPPQDVSQLKRRNPKIPPRVSKTKFYSPKNTNLNRATANLGSAGVAKPFHDFAFVIPGQDAHDTGCLTIKHVRAKG